MSTAQPSPRRSWRTPLLAILAMVIMLSATGCGQDAYTSSTRLYTDPGNPLLSAASVLKANGHAGDAAELEAIASTPAGIWAAGAPDDMQRVRQAAKAAAKAHEIPVIVAYNLPNRDACGKFSATPAGGVHYEAWVRQLAAAIGSANAIVVVEPDGLPDIVRGCLSAAQSTQRYQLLRYAMKTLGALPKARVYLDAGNPGMFSGPGVLAGPLKRAGVQYGRGFSANVSNFQWTSVVVSWSQRLERGLGGKLEAVVDTSRNGNGPYTGRETPQWCNPPGRAPGPTPRLDPGPAGIDGYLWIKNPGVSDGPCNGGPEAGQFWTRYAVGLARSRRT
jgi:endoglucanase